MSNHTHVVLHVNREQAESWSQLASSSSTWAERRHAARRVHLAALQCGELTIQAVRDRSTIVVRGRSGGGLLGPLFVLANAARRDAFASLSTDLATWRVRAFAGTDGDRIEAARQLQRSGGKYALVSLCIGGGQGMAVVLERV